MDEDDEGKYGESEEDTQEDGHKKYTSKLVTSILEETYLSSILAY